MSVNVTDYKSFEQLSEGIQRLNDKWKDAATSKDKERTFAGIQREMQNHHFFITNERKILHEELDKLKEVWSNKVIEERRKELIGRFDEMVSNMVRAVKQDIKALTSRKMEKIGDMLATAPTEEQLRLLSALQMRGDIDHVEVHHILPVFFGNYQAMRVLSAISEQNGITIALPVQLDCRTMFDTLNEAADYLLGACEELPKEWKKLHMSYHAFFTVNTEEKDKQYDPKYQGYIDLFDYTPQLQEVKTEKRFLSKGEKAKLDWYLRDVATLNPSDPGDYTMILHRVKEVMEEYPDSVNLLKMSDYKNFVTEVEEILQENKDN